MQLKSRDIKTWVILIFMVLTVFLSGVIGVMGASRKKDENAGYKIPLVEVVEAFKLDVKVDVITGDCVLKKDGKQVLLILNRGEIIAGRSVYKDECGIENGETFLTGRGVDLVLANLLGRRVAWRFEDGKLIVGKKIYEKRRGTRGKEGKKSGYRAKVGAVVIDPGHGGKDPGGIGYRGIKEKDIVLEISRYVVADLKRMNRGCRILMTRDTDEFISLEERAKIANSIDSALNPVFVSIHANVSYNKSAMGYESYYLTINPHDEEARKVAEKENSVINYEDIENKKYLEDIINRIIDLEYRRESIKLAGNIQESIKSSIGSISIDRGIKGAYFYVLKSVKMPSVLIEVGFVTNKVEALNLISKEYQKKLAKGIAEGISKFVQEFEDTNGFTEEPPE